MTISRLKLFAAIVVALLDFSVLQAGTKFTIEGASGFSSPNLPFSENWNGRVTNEGLLYREFALRGTAKINSLISLSFMVGWLREREDLRGMIISYGIDHGKTSFFPPYYSLFSREIVYYVPSIRLSSQIVRLDLGTIIYQVFRESPYSHFEYPFDGEHDFKPVFGVEFGEPGFYVLAKYFDEFPLYSGGGNFEIGLGGRYNEKFEHKIFFSRASYDYVGIGYRGEFGLYKNFALLLGLTAGGIENKSQYSGMIGVRTTLR